MGRHFFPSVVRSDADMRALGQAQIPQCSVQDLYRDLRSDALGANANWDVYCREHISAHNRSEQCLAIFANGFKAS